MLFLTLVSLAQFGLAPKTSPDSLYMTTSKGSLLHFDVRSGKMEFNVKLSPKKINTCDMSSNGVTMATAGLENCVSLWDVRKMKSKKALDRIDQVRSITSAYFNSTGDKLLTTGMNDKLNVLSVDKGGKFGVEKASVSHDNQVRENDEKDGGEGRRETT